MCKDDTSTSRHLTLTLKNISDLALEVGFDACGVADVHRLDDDDEIFHLLCNFEDVDFDKYFTY